MSIQGRRAITIAELKDYIDCKQKWSLSRYEYDEKKLQAAKKESKLRLELRLKGYKFKKYGFGFFTGPVLFFGNLIFCLIAGAILYGR